VKRGCKVNKWMQHGKTALITGGSSGIGYAIADECVRRGMNVIILARRIELLKEAKKKLEELADRSSSATVKIVSADVSSIHSIRIVEEDVRRNITSIDLLVNCAGVVKPALLEDFTDSDMNNQILINLLGMMNVTRQFLKYIPAGGAIINFSSALGLFGMAGYTAYSASKFGIIGFSDALRRELLSRKISVHVVCPADVDTPQFKQEHEDMPDWMKTESRPNAISPAAVAKKVLQAAQHGKFYILTNGSVKFLLIMLRFLPRLTKVLLDGMFPRPKAVSSDEQR